MSTQGSQRRIDGRHVLAMVLGFFAVVLVANGVFLALALGTFGGLVTDQPYLRGLRYNEVLAAAETQDALGWQVELDVTELDRESLAVSTRFTDPNGDRLNDLAVIVELRRPTHDGLDQKVRLTALAQGRFDGVIPVPLRGQWQLHLCATRKGTTVYRREQRLWLN